MLLTQEQAVLPHGLPLLHWPTRFSQDGFLWFGFFFLFISLQLLVLKPPALRQLSQKDSKKRREKEGAEQKEMPRCLSINHVLHSKGLCGRLGLVWPVLRASVGEKALGGSAGRQDLRK